MRCSSTRIKTFITNWKENNNKKNSVRIYVYIASLNSRNKNTIFSNRFFISALNTPLIFNISNFCNCLSPKLCQNAKAFRFTFFALRLQIPTFTFSYLLNISCNSSFFFVIGHILFWFVIKICRNYWFYVQCSS